MIHKIGLRVCTLLLTSVLVAQATASVYAADHLDAPNVRTDSTLDINDLYVFQSPQTPSNVVLIMTVNPFAGTMNSATTFNSRAVYEFSIDTNGDAIPNFAYRIYFTAPRGGSQRFIVVQANGNALASGQTGRATVIRGGGFVTAGLFDDPFFFDRSVLASPPVTGTDDFAANNVSAIVLEVPRSVFGTDNIAVGARTTNRNGQFDRVGRPAINTVLIPAGLKDAFNVSDPRNDVVQFRPAVVSTLLSLGNTQVQADGLANVLLPDLLTIDTSSSAGFLNGRRLADDVIDAELDLLTQGALTSDGVSANDKQFSTTFPYLAAPHVIVN